MWPTVYTCPNITYSVGVLNCYCSNLRSTHCNLVIQIFRYLFKIFNLKIILIANSENDLINYTNSDYTKLLNGRKSTNGYIFILSSRPLFYQLKLQSTFGLLSIEAEYIATIKAKKKLYGSCNFWLVLNFIYIVNLLIYVPIIKRPFH